MNFGMDGQIVISVENKLFFSVEKINCYLHGKHEHNIMIDALFHSDAKSTVCIINITL